MLYQKIFLCRLNEDLKPYQRTGTRGLTRKRLNQVPAYARGRGDLNPKVEQMRSGKVRHVVLSPSDIAYVRDRYNIHEWKPGVKLGSTGIMVANGPTPGSWRLVK